MLCPEAKRSENGVGAEENDSTVLFCNSLLAFVLLAKMAWNIAPVVSWSGFSLCLTVDLCCFLARVYIVLLKFLYVAPVKLFLLLFFLYPF